MAIQLSELIEDARYSTSVWSEVRQPHGVIMRHISRRQRALVEEALLYDKQYLAQKLAFVVKDTAYDGYPAQLSGSTVTYEDTPAGDLAEFEAGTQFDTGVADDTSTSTTLVDSVKSWTTNAYANKYVHIYMGTGKDQWRKIVSNTATALTIDSSYPWTAIPDSTSLYEIVSLSIVVDEDAKMVKDIEPIVTSPAYSVKVDATGTAYIATDEPIELPTRAGLTLPENVRIIGGTQYRAEYEYGEVHVVPFHLRFQPPLRPAVYILNNELYLIEPGSDYTTDDVIEIQYVPIPPRLTATDDYLLVPEAARTYLEWEAHVAMERRWPTGSQEWVQEAATAKQLYLTTLAGRPRVDRVKEVW